MLQYNKQVVKDMQMADQKIADMTLSDLEALIAQIVDRRIKKNSLHERPKDTRSREEVLESIKRNRWTPPPGAPSTLEMLREDRDR
jgi:hypothetical protein